MAASIDWLFRHTADDYARYAQYRRIINRRTNAVLQTSGNHCIKRSTINIILTAAPDDILIGRIIYNVF